MWYVKKNKKSITVRAEKATGCKAITNLALANTVLDRSLASTLLIRGTYGYSDRMPSSARKSLTDMGIKTMGDLVSARANADGQFPTWLRNSFGCALNSVILLLEHIQPWTSINPTKLFMETTNIEVNIPMGMNAPDLKKLTNAIAEAAKPMIVKANDAYVDIHRKAAITRLQSQIKTAESQLKTLKKQTKST